MKRKLALLIIFFILAGCQLNEQETEHPILTETSSDSTISQSIANQAVNTVLQREEVTKANAVNTDKLLLLAFEVEQFERFNLKIIEKKIKKQLNEQFKDIEVVVSYDPKIMLEIEKLQAKVESNNIDTKKLKKETKKIVKLKREKT
ncbi:YhcN/YlaJ family sporulation lipoprotein [Pueribacillus sp. YX66]|uniref:YhcN/YlaJ family sporulation lipoprotein n=1 Tax=Pueribacillus sp. YX66 TaxID=3229242 RepID=UPI00358CFD72